METLTKRQKWAQKLFYASLVYTFFGFTHVTPLLYVCPKLKPDDELIKNANNRIELLQNKNYKTLDDKLQANSLITEYQNQIETITSNPDYLKLDLIRAGCKSSSATLLSLGMLGFFTSVIAYHKKK